jgi:hypothetical protein
MGVSFREVYIYDKSDIISLNISGINAFVKEQNLQMHLPLRNPDRVKTYIPMTKIYSNEEKPMTAESTHNEKENRKPKESYRGGASEAVYGLGLIGACVYYIGQATTFWMGVLGFLKALVWPAFLVFQALKALGM